MSPTVTVVVIDNDEACLTAFGRVLREGGLDPALYTSAEAFLASPPARRPHCIVLDIFLAGMSGLDLQRRLNSLGSRIPVIVMTAFEDARIRAQAQQLGCVAYIDKTTNVDRLLELIRSCERDSHQRG